jgi:hypothetical protein
MKKTLVPLFLFLSFLSQAQTTSVTLSKKFSLKEHGSTMNGGQFFKVGDNWFAMELDYAGMQFAYTAKLDKIKYGINILKYDAGMKEVKKISFQGKEKQFGPFIPRLVLFHDKLILLYYQSMADNSIKLSMAVIDPETLDEISGKDLYSISQRNVGLFKIEGALSHNHLMTEASPDSSRLLIAQAGNTNELFSCLLGADMIPVRKMVSKFKSNMVDIDVEHFAIDNALNRYFGYRYKTGQAKNSGILLQDNKGKEALLPVNAGKGAAFEIDEINLAPSKDHTKMYAYATYGYGENAGEGILLTTVDANAARIGQPQLFPFPMDVRLKLEKKGYADKHNGNMGLVEMTYESTELEDGTLALTGVMRKEEIKTINTYSSIHDPVGHTSSDAVYYSGPLITAMIRDNKCSFAVLYRNQLLSSASQVILHPYGDKLVCFYTVAKKHLESDDLRKPADPDDLILAEAVFSSDGKLVSREMIGDKAGSLDYFISEFKPLSANSYIFPLARLRANMARYYVEMEQWVTLDIH